MKPGDPVYGKDWHGSPIAGVVVKTTPGAETCNIVIAQPTGLPSYNSKDFMHADDVDLAATPASPATTA